MTTCKTEGCKRAPTLLKKTICRACYVRIKRKEYIKSPEYRARCKANRSTPEQKAKTAARDKKYAQQPGWKEKHRENVRRWWNKFYNERGGREIVSHRRKTIYKEYQRRVQNERLLWIKQATPPWVDRKALNIFYKNTPKGMTVDHIIPFKNPEVCGLHVPWNLQYLTKSENSKKYNKLILLS